MAFFQKEDHDLFNQGKSTGSGLFGDEASEGHRVAFLDETGHGFSDLSPGSPFDPDAAVVSSSGQSSEALQVLDVETFSRHLDRAWHSLEQPSTLKFPWEQGIWNEIFGPCDRASSAVVPKLVRPKVVPVPNSAPVLHPVEKSRRLAPVLQSWQQVVMASDVATWQEMHDAKLDTALKRWFDVVIMFPSSFQLVFQLAALTSVAEQMTMMRDVIGSRSPLTLLKRVNSITRYMTFLRSKGITAPGVESDFYSFLNEQMDSGAPPSRLAATVESVRFMEHVVGLTGVIDLLSRRCLGAAKLPTAGPKQQASPLTVGELVALHAILLDETEDVWDRNMAGAFLCCVYTRSRWSDMQHTNLLMADPDKHMPEFLELSIADYKTKAANAWRGGLLAAVAPAVGVSFENWGSVWLVVREALGAPLSEGFPLMPAPDMAGDPTRRPISTKEVSGWIKLLLNRRGLDSGERRLSSHSAKATMLSYLAKYGADLAMREILGGHVSHLQSVIRYSRDALAEPLRVLCRMLLDIRVETFVSDATRSGYFREVAPEFSEPVAPDTVEISDEEAVKVELPEPAVPQEQQPEVELDTDSSSDEDGVSSAKCGRAVTVPKAPPGFKLYQHTKSRMLHLMDQEHNKVFQCGRMAGPKHEVSETSRLRWDTPCCGKCWRAAGHTLGPRFVVSVPDNKGAGSAADQVA